MFRNLRISQVLRPSRLRVSMSLFLALSHQTEAMQPETWDMRNERLTILKDTKCKNTKIKVSITLHANGRSRIQDRRDPSQPGGPSSRGRRICILQPEVFNLLRSSENFSKFLECTRSKCVPRGSLNIIIFRHWASWFRISNGNYNPKAPWPNARPPKGSMIRDARC